MKRIICFLIVLTMVFSLVSCKDSNAEGNNVSSEVISVSSGTVDDTQSNNTSSDIESVNSNTTDTSSEQNTSLNTEVSSNTSLEETTKPLKPYSGNLPSIVLGKIPQFAERKFEISGFWAPYDITEEAFKQYKDVGFTTLAMINHSLNRTSDEQFYLGSKRTMKALEVCKKVGLKAILNYNDWMAEWTENNSNYNGETPFSKYDLYGEYKDIITGIHICDEPYKDKHFPLYGKKTLINDFKKVYPNAKYIVNLIPITALSSRGFSTYDEMMELYENTFMAPFENPFVSVDVYPFHVGSGNDDGTLALNYEYIAKSAKKFGVKPGFILQSSTGGEFEGSLTEGDLRWEINSALAFGADTLQYYCYSVPFSLNDNDTKEFMYDYCILNRDDTPSPIYYYLQKLHKEIQSFSNVILAYNWEESIGVLGSGDYAGRVSHLAYDQNFENRTFIDPKHFVDVTSTEELIVSRFTNDKYGEAYMFVNFADKKDNAITASFRNCKAVAVYNSKTGSTPKIINLDKNGKATLQLTYGEGLFVIPLV